jgi:hypothetical protein
MIIASEGGEAEHTLTIAEMPNIHTDFSEETAAAAAEQAGGDYNATGQITG